MAYEIVLPRLGWSMESGRLAEWLKKDGDVVQVGDMIFSVEGDKAIQEVEALENGILRILPDGPGFDQEVKVGTLLAYICQPGEKPPFEMMITPASQPKELVPIIDQPINKADLPAINQPSMVKTKVVITTISPRARRVARELAVDWSAIRGSGITGRIREQDIRAAVHERLLGLGKPLAAPNVVDVFSTIAHSKVVLTTMVKTMASEPAEMIKTVAERLSTSLQTAASVTLTTEIDATDLYQSHQRWMNDPDLIGHVIPSVTDMLVKLVSQALIDYPLLNARLEGMVEKTSTTKEIVYQQSINIGLNMESDAGMVVPVVRDVQKKGLKQIARETALMDEKVKAGKLSLEDTSGGTFTITDLGMYDIDSFTPIINLPQCAILGIGRIVAKPVVMDEVKGTTAIRWMMVLSLTFDHRIVDGAPAARFLKRIKQLAEKPDYWLI
jgi:pyruvate dehydrogenase E2 component (dihydrolipoamide acetyltransferase)